MSTDWLQALKPGDAVIVSTGQGWFVDKVVRVTATQISLERSHYKYRRKEGHTGYAIGQSHAFHRDKLIEATPERLVQTERASLINRLCHLRPSNFKHLTVEQLRNIAEIIKP